MDGEANSLVHVNVELGKEAEKTACDLLRSLVGTAVTEAAGLLGDQV